MLNIGDVIGEPWCLSLVRDRTPEEVLIALGVDPATIRSRNLEEFDNGQDISFAHPLPSAPAWTLAVEFGASGFVGWLPETLKTLTAAGRRVRCDAS